MDPENGKSKKHINLSFLTFKPNMQIYKTNSIQTWHLRNRKKKIAIMVLIKFVFLLDPVVMATFHPHKISLLNDSRRT